YRRYVETAKDIGDGPFWNPVRCDRRGRLIQMVDLNYTCGEAIDLALPSAVMVRKCLKDTAESMAAQNRFLEWRTPAGFPVSNRYTKSKTTRINLPFLGQMVTIAIGYTNEPKVPKIKDAVTANFVHSMDAAHLVLSVNAAVVDGITNIMTVHDCFATLAP